MPLSTHNREFHVALRMPQIIRLRGHELDVIARHNEVIDRDGEVAFGKFGSKLAPEKRSIIEKQNSQDLAGKLYVIIRSPNGYQANSSPIVRIDVSDDPLQGTPYPSYYDWLPDQPTMSFILRERLELDTMDELKLASTNQMLEKVLLQTRTPMMMVYSQSS